MSGDNVLRIEDFHTIYNWDGGIVDLISPLNDTLTKFSIMIVLVSGIYCFFHGYNKSKNSEHWKSLIFYVTGILLIILPYGLMKLNESEHIIPYDAIENNREEINNIAKKQLVQEGVPLVLLEEACANKEFYDSIICNGISFYNPIEIHKPGINNSLMFKISSHATVHDEKNVLGGEISNLKISLVIEDNS